MKPEKLIMASLRKADNDFDLIQNGDKIAVGISGGKDSSVLLYSLNFYKQISCKNFEVMGIYIDLGFGQENMNELIDYFNNIGVEIKIVPTQIADILNENRKNDKVECSLCSRLRKGALVNASKEYNCNKVAFGHHSDDAIETLFMNMIHGGRIATFSPNMELEGNDIKLIRPLIYAEEYDIARMSRNLNIPISKNVCPNEGHTQRAATKELLKDIYKQYPQAKNNFLVMIKNTENVELWDKNKS